ncbi:hypothetical protein [Chitinophaga nivalis]|uniref:Uncharacterized protein n=1 Tax=Chitinophaga nivalis TaxID=2991709 RepID=A0ABT3IJA1_9BACT|nr:hypothetical protein [Chitinophaga nivalis]MCW3466276.1 hypothetical protein [Chitinophaga nivalis]MCW3484033.1 hypothetical protein [Chitinophaga nivalis]
MQHYQPRVSIHWWVFAMISFLSVAIAIVTVSYQATKAGMVNPVKSRWKG